MSGFLGAGVRGDVSFIVDGRGNLGFAVDIGGGGYNAVGFNRFGPFLTITNAPSIEKVQGWSVQLGGQIGNGASVGGEKVLFRDEIQRYEGLSIAGGMALIGPWPGEIHATAVHTTIYPLNEWR